MEFIQLTLTSTEARTTITLNEFPLVENKKGITSLPLDLFLVEHNTLQVNIIPEGNGHLTLRISKAESGSMVDSSDTTPALFNINEDITSETTRSHTFDTPDKTLGNRLFGKPLSSTEAHTYAQKLGQFILQKNYDLLISELRPKFEDYATLYPETSLTQLNEGFKQVLQNLQITFDPSRITVQSLCSGRVYRLIHDGKPFITAANQRGGRSIIEFYIANVNGTPQVVR